MITKLHFDNFKCLDKQEFEFKSLNILSGYNGRGKSSVLQSLLMLSQSCNYGAGSLSKLHISGNKVDLGSYIEILTNDKIDNVGFNIETDDPQFRTIKISYTMSTEDECVGEISAFELNSTDNFDTVGAMGEENGTTTKVFKSIPEGLITLLRTINFISADRTGPRKYVEKLEVPDQHIIDSHGLNAINTIKSFRESIPISMNCSGIDKDLNLLEATSTWVNYIMGTGSIRFHEGDKKSPVLSIEFGIDRNGEGRNFTPINVGFGYSYILAIIVAALIAKKDSIVIVENPEAHLHAKAQSRLTELLARLASRGVQVFIETHSEHIVNGVRLEMLRDNCNLSNSDISLYFFDEDFSVKHLELKRNGRIPNWPEGFFDQSKHDLGEIMELGAKVHES